MSTVYDLPGDIPDRVDWCRLDIEIVASAGAMGEEEPPPPSTYIIGTSDVYVVLTTPQSPTITAWINILQFSTTAASHAEDEQTAQQMLVWEMWGAFDYLPRNEPYWTSTSGNTETFYAKYFFDNKYGQCNDFADGLVCAGSVLGIYSTPQRSYPNDGNKLRIQTDPVHPAGGTPGGTPAFRFHQFMMKSNAVFDAAVKVYVDSNYEFVIGFGESSYESALVNFLWDDEDLDWQWDANEGIWYPPSSLFYPNAVYLTLTASDKP
jgi:hypothetical protein